MRRANIIDNSKKEPHSYASTHHIDILQHLVQQKRCRPLLRGGVRASALRFECELLPPWDRDFAQTQAPGIPGERERERMEKRN